MGATMKRETEYFWPVINGLEWQVEYQIKLIDSEPDSYLEPGYETWVLDTGTEMVTADGPVGIWIPDAMLEKLCQDHFDKHH
jgi:hypothetical protein